MKARIKTLKCGDCACLRNGGNENMCERPGNKAKEKMKAHVRLCLLPRKKHMKIPFRIPTEAWNHCPRYCIARKKICKNLGWGISKEWVLYFSTWLTVATTRGLRCRISPRRYLCHCAQAEIGLLGKMTRHSRWLLRDVNNSGCIFRYWPVWQHATLQLGAFSAISCFSHWAPSVTQCAFCRS